MEEKGKKVGDSNPLAPTLMDDLYFFNQKGLEAEGAEIIVNAIKL